MRGTICLCFAIAFGFAVPGYAAEPCGTIPAWLARTMANNLGSRTGTVCTLDESSGLNLVDTSELLQIQVVVHNIHREGSCPVAEGCITQQVIENQLAVVEDDLNGLGDASPDGFDANVELVLVAVNDVGSDDYFTCAYPCTEMKSTLSATWDPAYNLNIYTLDTAGLRGWATFPQVPEAGTASDGVVIDFRVVGDSSDGLLPPYDRGHSLAHQVGHYLGLLHVFAPVPTGCPSGDTGALCYSDDGDLLCDTEPAFEADYTCDPSPFFPCNTEFINPMPATGNLMNFSDDDCMDGFSNEQVRRMRCALEEYRSETYIGMIFTDGFESGNTSAWSGAVAKMTRPATSEER